MSIYQKLADDLTESLELSLPPIAIAFSDVAPANVPAPVRQSLERISS